MKSTPVIAYSFVGILFLVAELTHALTCYEDDPEMYDWPRALHSSPKFGAVSKPDFMLRCVCNFDLCNVPTTFEPYLEGLKKHELADEKE